MKGFRTIAVNVLMAGVGVAAIANADLAASAPTEAEIRAAVEKIATGYVAAATVVNFFLRFVTSTPIFKKE